jgi:hypothetical protein
MSWKIRTLLKWYIWILSTLQIVPKEVMDKIQAMEYGVDGVVEGSEAGIFTAMWWLISRKTGAAPAELLDHV